MHRDGRTSLDNLFIIDGNFQLRDPIFDARNSFSASA